MAWKRGTQNNSAGEIRKGHIREFLAPSSKAHGVVGKLRIMAMEGSKFQEDYGESYFSLVCEPPKGLPSQFHGLLDNGLILLHSHQHPRCVVSALVHPDVPEGCIVMNEIQCLNSKVCTGELEDWTVYQGDSFAYDSREGAIGDTEVRYIDGPTKHIKDISMWIRPRYPEQLPEDGIVIDGKRFGQVVLKYLFGAIVSIDEVFQITIDDVPMVCRVAELEAAEEQNDDEYDEENDFVMPDCHRGRVDVDAAVYLWPENIPGSNMTLVDNPVKCVDPSSAALANVVIVRTSDDEEFPVKRRLLRPCIALTSVVQAGRGKYKTNSPDDTTVSGDAPDEGEKYSVNDISVNVDACTFDRVLLYLEHEARGQVFKFDPLIATELLEAAETLQISGLRDCCQKSLGSFEERVRKTPIPLQEVFDRNDAGRKPVEEGDAGDGVALRKKGARSETLLILSGMVFNISRWLDEHPGGSTIIPEQALNMDCTVFFEIYHASRQSFLYLKEFYIGELAEEDLPLVPRPPGNAEPSAAFMEQLRRVTPWRLKPEQLTKYVMHKSF